MSADESRSLVLAPTLQTWCGMVLDNGKPTMREFPNMNASDLESLSKQETQEMIQRIIENPLEEYPRWQTEWLQVFTKMCVERKFPEISELSDKSELFVANIYACTRDVNVQTLKQYFVTQKRLDIEQSAALIISLLLKHKPELACKLIPHLSHIIFNACMWLPPNDATTDVSKFAVKAQKFIDKLQKYHNLQKELSLYTASLCKENLAELVSFLEKVRRKNSNRGLRIPAVFYEEANLSLGENYTNIDKKGDSWLYKTYQDTKDTNVINVGRKRFNKIARMVIHMQGKINAAAILRRKIWKLKEKMLNQDKTAVTETKDVISLAFAFITLQRHLQLKVVSDLNWTAFLKKGEIQQTSQNTPNILSTFEIELAEAAIKQETFDISTLTSVITPPMLINQSCKEQKMENEKQKSEELKIPWKMEKYIQLVDDACVLAEEYVWMHGEGKFDNLCFKRGVSGGKRGPVDDYNLICDILRTFCERLLVAQKCQEVTLPPQLLQCLPMKNQKFLAKDIMSWNNAWKDDAFAAGRRPSWLQWLKYRRSDGSLCQTEYTLQ